MYTTILGGFGYLAGHDIKRPDGAYKFSLRKQQPLTSPNSSTVHVVKSVVYMYLYTTIQYTYTHTHTRTHTHTHTHTHDIEL